MAIETFINQIVCMDALELLAQLPDGSVDMVLTSPPYDNLRTYNGFTWDFESIARQTYRVLKAGGVLVWVVGDATANGSETLTSMRQALYFVDVCGFKMHDTMIYNKNSKNPNIHHPRYMQQFEYMFVLSKGDVLKLNALMERNNLAGQARILSTKTQRNGEKKVWGQALAYAETSKRGNIWTYTTGAASGDDMMAFDHPAPFPEQLAHDHIYSWSNPGDIVLDYFMGSGTTAKIARNLGRRFVGCDLSHEYVQLANTRLQNTDPYQPTILKNGMKQLSLFAEENDE